MLQQRAKNPRLTSALAVCAALAAGCGGAGSGSGGGMSQDAAEAFAGQLSRASTNAVLNNQPTANAALARSGEIVTCTSDGSSCTINQSISHRVNCTAGGAINLTGSLTGTMNSSGTGLLQISVTETISDWMCIGDLVINGDPYITMTGQFSYMNGQPSTSQHLSIDGGFKWGTSSDESCQIHLSTNFSSGGHGTTTGTVCGHTISASF